MSALRGASIKAGAQRLLLAALVASAAGGVLWLRAVERAAPPAPPPAIGPAATDADMVMRDFRHVETRMDRTVWVLEAQQAEVREERANLLAVKVTWYGERGTVPVVVTSESGKIDFKTRNAVLTGKVRLVRADGAVLETEKLFWEEQHRVLEAPLPVLITTAGFTFRAASLFANVDREYVKLKGQVAGEIRGGVPLAAGRS